MKSHLVEMPLQIPLLFYCFIMLLMMFLGRANEGEKTKNKIRNIFCVPETKFVSATNVARAGKRGNICVGNNVSSYASALTP